MGEKCPEHPDEKMIACLECLFDTAEDEKEKMINRIRELKTDDKFHEWYKDILGKDDILVKIVDKVIEEITK
jgi:hypothetical protein